MPSKNHKTWLKFWGNWNFICNGWWFSSTHLTRCSPEASPICSKKSQRVRAKSTFQPFNLMSGTPFVIVVWQRGRPYALQKHGSHNVGHKLKNHESTNTITFLKKQLFQGKQLPRVVQRRPLLIQKDVYQDANVSPLGHQTNTFSIEGIQVGNHWEQWQGQFLHISKNKFPVFLDRTM